jgi:Ca2+-binding EF-hand superfamily protein
MTPMRIACSAVTVAAMLAGSGLAPLSASADEETVKHHILADTDENGYVDRGEYYYRMVQIFYFSDDDRDGTLTIIEIGRVDPEDFAVADTDGDEKLDLHEYTEARDPEFEELDQDSDGRITRQEAADFREEE